MRPPEIRLFEGEIIVDNFAGGGGASVGIEWGLGRSPDIAINHDAQAVAMHAANHPETKHYVEDVWKVDPVKACGGRPVGLAWFSPDCKHFSKAKGGKPVSKKIRGLAWIVVKWAKLVKPRVIMLENVEEFQTWGPLGDDDRPNKLKKGHTFQRWKAQLENLGYKVEFREVVAANYGAPTTRKRLFLIARRDGRPIVWPKPTHDQHGRLGLPKWRAAAECIDWSLPCPSIFDSSEEIKRLWGVSAVRPLAANTMRRIYAGLMKFVVNNPKPFIVRAAHGDAGPNSKRWGKGDHDTAEPLPTVTASKDFALVTPVISALYGDKGAVDSAGRCQDVRSPLPTQTGDPRFAVVSAGIVPLTHQGGDRNESTEEPMRTITGAHRGEKALAAAYVTRIGQTGSRGDNVRSAEDPVSTVTSKAEHLLTTAYLAGVGGRKGQSPETSVEAPYHTITAKGDTVIVAPILAGAGGPEYAGKPTAVDRPIGALTSENHRAVIGATLIQTGYGERDGQQPRAPGLDKPLGTVVAGGGKHALVAAFMAQHNYLEPGHPMEHPVSTIVGKGCTQGLVAANLVVNTTGHSGAAADTPVPTITGGGHHALVASSIVKLKGTAQHGQQLDLPLHTVQAGGQHYAKADAFLIAYYGNEKDGQPVDEAMRTLTARDRLGLVRVEGDWYRIEDIGMRMLVPRELYTAQGFPITYRIAITYNGKPLPKDAQVRMCGNSVSPYPCAALVAAQFAAQDEEQAA